MLDTESFGLEQLDEQAPALVLPLPGGDAVRDGDDGGLGPQTGSFDFSTSVTSPTTIWPSIAFAMS